MSSPACRIFIVEDETLIAMYLRDRLEHQGYVVCGVASRGEVALKEIPACSPGLVLMDIHLAGKLTGIETAARLREVVDLPVVFLSAFSDYELLQQAGRVESFGYLLKPVEERALHTTIQIALYKHGMERALREANAGLETKVRHRTEELERTVESLRQSEARYHTLFEESVDGVALADPETGILIDFNRAFCELVGWSREELVGKSQKILHPPEDVPGQVSVTFERHRSKDLGKTIETRVITKAGEIKDVEIKAPHLAVEGSPILLGVFRDITQRKRADAEIRKLNENLENLVVQRTARLAESEERFRQLAENMRDLLCMLDLQGRFVYASPSFQTVLGYTAEELKGDGALDRVHPGDAAAVAETLRRVLEEGRPQQIEFRYRHREGRYIWIEASGSAILCPGGAVSGCVITSRDITGRKTADAALRRANRALRMISECNQALMRASDEVRLLQEVCRFVIDFGGYRMAWVGLAGEDEARTVQPVARAGYEEGYVESARISWGDNAHGRGPTGTAIRERHPVIATNIQTDPQFALWREAAVLRGYASSIALPLLLNDGRCLGALNVYAAVPDAFDEQEVPFLTELANDLAFGIRTLRDRAAREKAEQSQARFASILEATTDFVATASTDQRPLYMNKGARRLLGLGADEDISGMHLGETHPEWARKIAMEQGIPTAIREGIWSGETAFLSREGKEIPVSQLILAHKGPDGQIEFISTIARDITEWRKLERQMNRTQRLEAIGTLAGGIAHDLNNALTPVTMAVELLKMRDPGEVALLDRVESSARHAAEMVRQLVTFAKGAEGQRMSVQPWHLVREMEKIIKGTFPKNIQLRSRHTENVPTILGDATQLHQVLLNLCVNARDAMPNGGILTIEALSTLVDAAFAASLGEKNVKPGCYTVLRVGDTGTGIPPEILDRIFDPFFTTKGPEKGTGLGLSTVIGIAKGHGGFVQVSSQPGFGTVFAVYLPSEQNGAAVSEPVAKAATTFRGHGECILFVDDEPALCDIGQAVLQRLNFNPITATDGTDAIMKVAEHRADLCAVITDVNMPHMDGLALVRTLRRTLPAIPVVVASGRLEDGLVEEFKALGVRAFLDKPFTESMMAETLRAALEGSDARPTFLWQA
jgi:PAS domain S-box-containing protein